MTVQRDDRPRSMERRRLYTIFAPLDANEPLPRELLQEARRFSMFWGEDVPLGEDAVGRRELAGLLWLPALGLLLLLTAWANMNVVLVLGGAVLLAAGTWMFARSGERKSR
ncbi:MAG TPA: hypothetical protein VGU71_21185 [Candidatus Dormibacteraeota bacterium]|nr:hypothetical protein [Candidatus Dormibacteraeota bacterium]